MVQSYGFPRGGGEGFREAGGAAASGGEVFRGDGVGTGETALWAMAPLMFHGKQFLNGTFPDICPMARKKWTPQPEVTDAVLKFREKRKWQIALRRYVLEQRWSAAYAPFFGIDILRFREWIALQFSGDQAWDNFSEQWQFDHILPVAYFDFLDDQELRLCWNFTNIRVQSLDAEAGKSKVIDILGAKNYFEALHNRTGYALCGDLIEKINAIEKAQRGNSAKQEAFLEQHHSYLTTISSFSEYEYSQLNEGISLPVILEGRAFSKRVHDTGQGVDTGTEDK